MQKMRVIATAFVILLTSLSAKCQYYYYNNNYYDKPVVWEVGASAGLMAGMTDIGGRKGFMPDLKASQLNGSFYVGALYQNVAGLRLETSFGRIAGADSNGLHKKRNLSYRTSIHEIALIGEFHPLMLRYYDELPAFSPYVALGVGWFSFNPQANLNGAWIDLQPLRTEGQGFPEKPGTQPYRLSSTSIIGGIGLKYDLSYLITARVELLVRNTFTDYLDDAHGTYIDPSLFDRNLSPQLAAVAKQLHDRSIKKDPLYSGPGAIRAGAESNDHYMSFNFKLALNLGRQKIY